MTIWQADFYRRPLKNELDQALWELLICDQEGNLKASVLCPQAEATADWLKDELIKLAASLPERIQVFRPQTLNLLETACQSLGIVVEATRHTPALHQWLERRSQDYPSLPEYNGQPYQPLNLDRPPPLPLPENLWGDRWRFATLAASGIAEVFKERPIPILDLPAEFLPLNLGLASDLAVPGIVIDGGRQSMRLARWLEASHPYSLNFLAGAPDGLVLEAGLVDRWIVATFEDSEVRSVATQYENRKQASRGLHFLLVQPDDSGMTYTGFWLLREYPT
ncbi:hypothetical protein BST81_01825 [Leptolyngbya sp. 'hensonii']|uniref:Tab2/Atab2 family RNA-binding protein n=1 Tax=Leptolyngbya sp. 'hensonii' TaxID=1922337 RepID=UPI00095009C4|nr:Tab2/Atab2 family RNA-binding protein [Leptolyngbya sp. 'hensonii']OLP20195.1 hypothetical protein BST81_01825 [Leptolyngbya sp. 'hensonii']